MKNFCDIIWRYFEGWFCGIINKIAFLISGIWKSEPSATRSQVSSGSECSGREMSPQNFGIKALKVPEEDPMLGLGKNLRVLEGIVLEGASQEIEKFSG